MVSSREDFHLQGRAHAGRTKKTGRRGVPFCFDAEAKTYSVTASSTPVSGTAIARLLSFSRIRADLPERSRR